MAKEFGNIISLESFRKKPVGTSNSGHWIGPGWNTAFAYVLNVPDTECIWPGDAADLFFPELFALRMSDEYGFYVLDNYVHEHMRCETLRLCLGQQSALEYMEKEIEFYRRMEGSFPSTLFNNDEY
jgi:hypothetical protein